MSQSGASLQRKEVLDEIINVSQRSTTRQRQVAQETDSRFANIQQNPFFSALFDESLAPEKKQETVTKLLVFEGTREENRERVKAFDMIKEYLQSVREQMHSEIIRMSDPENFSTLKTVMEDMNNGLILFEDKMRPLTEIIDALHILRAENMTMDAFREIQDEDKRKEAQEARQKEIDDAIAEAQSQLNTLNADIAALSEKKSLFGFGGIKQSAREEIARKNVTIDNTMADLEELTAKADTLTQEKVSGETALSENAQAAKEKLRELLDISTDDHQERSKELINAALNFVQTSKEKTAQVHNQLNKMDTQIRNLADSNDKMSFIYAILNEGVKGAEDKNKDIRQELINKPESTNTIEKLQRETKQRDIDEHIKLLEISGIDTKNTLADLTTGSIRIKNMKDSNESQINMVRDMHTRGVAGVADRLSTVIQAVGAAAITEANSITAETLNAMQSQTDVITQKESMRIAMGVGERSERVNKAIESLIQYGEVNKAATDFTRNAMAELRENMAELEQETAKVADSVAESRSVAADVAMGETKTKGKEAPKANDPFKF